ncbi:hypothetical protein LPJ57_007528, partial [Coemansia sp. RSA 486]
IASAKPYDSLRKQIIKSAVKPAFTSSSGMSSTAASSGASASGEQKNAVSSSESESESSSESDSDSDSSDDDDGADENANKANRNGTGAKRVMISTPLAAHKPRPSSIRFAGNKDLSTSARARRKRSSLLSL